MSVRTYLEGIPHNLKIAVRDVYGRWVLLFAILWPLIAVSADISYVQKNGLSFMAMLFIAVDITIEVLLLKTLLFTWVLSERLTASQPTGNKVYVTRDGDNIFTRLETDDTSGA